MMQSPPFKRILFIVNPNAGVRFRRDLSTWLETFFCNQPVEIEIAKTQYINHAFELATMAASQAVDCVVAVGGDGTCNEVARALVHTNTVLGIVPMGSGNGLARHLGIPLNISRSVSLILKGRVQTIDYCLANDRPFFTTCGVGFDASVSKRFAKEKLRGGLTYIRNAVEEYLSYSPQTYIVKDKNGSVSEKAFLIACGNASQYGNNAFIAPHANMSDGMIDVTVLKPFSVLEIAPLTVQLFTKQIDKNSHIRTFSSSDFIIERIAPGIMHLDGEPIEMDASIRVQCVPSALKVCMPLRQVRRNPFTPIQERMHQVFFAIKRVLEGE